LIHFFKSKPFLVDIIPNDYIDIHSHLLPNIDDGSSDIENSIELILFLKKNGFNKFITTPHVMNGIWNNNKQSIQQNEIKTLTLINERIGSLDFKAAAEYMIDENFRKLFQNEKLLTLKDNYVLVELSYANPPLQLYEIIFELQIAGYKPILAHPERYIYFHNSLNEYKKLKNAGCLFQLNLLSTTGYYGLGITSVLDILLENNLIDFVGSDVHNMKHIESLSNKVILKKHKTLNELFNNNKLFNFSF